MHVALGGTATLSFGSGCIEFTPRFHSALPARFALARSGLLTRALSTGSSANAECATRTIRTRTGIDF